MLKKTLIQAEKDTKNEVHKKCVLIFDIWSHINDE